MNITSIMPISSRRAPGGQGGFTIVELLISLTVLIIGIAAALSLQVASMRASAISRHTQEASVLAEDVLEYLRTVPSAMVSTDSDQVDENGVADPEGMFFREWTVGGSTGVVDLVVTVSWDERGVEPHSVTFRSRRDL